MAQNLKINVSIRIFVFYTCEKMALKKEYKKIDYRLICCSHSPLASLVGRILYYLPQVGHTLKFELPCCSLLQWLVCCSLEKVHIIEYRSLVHSRHRVKNQWKVDFSFFFSKRNFLQSLKGTPKSNFSSKSSLKLF